MTGATPSGSGCQSSGPQPASPFSQSGIPSAWQPRSTAPKDRRILVSCSHSAPYPVMIAQWDGAQGKYVSHDKGSEGKTWTIERWQPLPTPHMDMACSFCGKTHLEVRKLIAGPSAFICDECVDLCDEIIDADAQAIEARRAETQSGSVHESAVRQDAPETPLSTPLPSGSIER